MVVLVVAGEDVRAGIGPRLEEGGFEVMLCPGPRGPEYRCVGGRVGACPLANGADVVVLDAWLPGDDALDGTPSEELLGLYLASGRPVALLRHRPARAAGGAEGTFLAGSTPSIGAAPPSRPRSAATRPIIASSIIGARET